MFKKIPQDQITRRTFNVYKDIKLTQDDVTVLRVHNVTGSYNEETDPLVGASGSFDGWSMRGLYNSAKVKYYLQSASLLEYGGGFTPSQKYVQALPATMSLLSFSNCVKGEAVLPGSFRLVDSGSGITIVDSERSTLITNETPEYPASTIELDSGRVILESGTELLLSSIDLNTGEVVLSYEGNTESPNPILVSLDLNDDDGGILTFTNPLTVLQGTAVEEDNTKSYGQLFPQTGDLVIDGNANPDMLQNFELQFKATTTISELEVLVSVNAGEFTTSTNPTAVDYFNITSQSVEHTIIDNNGNPFIETIKDFTPRKKSHIYSQYGNATGSFDDYEASSSYDPTGSYLTTYVTSIGLYDDNSDLLAIAKVARPVKLLPDYPINFLIKIDT